MTAEQKEMRSFAGVSADTCRALNLSLSIRFSAPVDRDILFEAIRHLGMRHESLRALFPADDSSMHVAETFSIEIPVVDFTGAAGNGPEQQLEEYTNKLLSEAFDLVNGPLFRGYLVQVTLSQSVFVCTLHRLIADQYTLHTITTELAELYSALIEKRQSSLPVVFPFSTYCHQQQSLRSAQEYQAIESYWLDMFKEPLPVLELPTAKQRPPLRTCPSQRLSYTVSDERTQLVFQAEAALGRRLFELAYSAYVVFIYRVTQKLDFVVGIPSVRQKRADDLELLGCCSGILPLRHTLNRAISFNDLVDDVCQKVSDSQHYSHFAIGDLLQALTIECDPCRESIVATTFNVELTDRHLSFADVSADYTINPGVFNRFELATTLQITSNGNIQIHCDYNTDLFDEGSVQQWLKSYIYLLEGALQAPDTPIADLPLLDKQSEHQLSVWNETAQAYPQDQCLHHLIVQQVPSYADKVAATFEDKQYSYRELNQRANCLANYLVDQGVGPNVLVGLCVERSLEMLVSLLGILKAGGGYLPLDPGYPRDRIEYILENAQAKLLLTESSLAECMPQHRGKTVVLDQEWPTIASFPETAPEDKVVSDDTAYVIYTSGSTGKPKGVQVTHRNVVNFLCSMQEQPGLSPDDKLLSVTTIAFDIAVLELYLPLITGASVDIASRYMALDASVLAERINTLGITVLQATPATWRLLLQFGWQGNGTLKALIGGEALPPDIVAGLLENTAELWNMYGPTETTVWSTCYRIQEASAPILIGAPIGNTQVYVLDPNGKRVPVGIPGELYIGGDGVTNGYLNRPELTEKSFIFDPFHHSDSAKLYRTGDQVKLLGCGHLQYLARLDHQVKVRGYRIELGEIESVLSSYPSITQAVVVTREDRPGDVRILGYYVAADSSEITIVSLREHMQRELPAYMIPHHFISLDAMPQTPNGKVDRKQLPVPCVVGGVDDSAPIAEPCDDLERSILTVWRRVLNNVALGVTDDFFECGGHSLLAIATIKEMTLAIGVELDVGLLFRYPTVKSLVASMADNVEQQASNIILLKDAETPEGEDKPPLFLLCGVEIYQELANLIEDRKVYGVYVFSELAIAKDALEGKVSDISYELLCSQYVDAILRTRSQGPYEFGGLSFGGFIAMEVARKMKELQHDVDYVYLLDSISPSAYKRKKVTAVCRDVFVFSRDIVKKIYQCLSCCASVILGRKSDGDGQLLVEHQRAEVLREQAFVSIMQANEDKRKIYDGNVVLFKAMENELPSWIVLEEHLGWKDYVSNSLRLVNVPGDHLGILDKDNVSHISDVINGLK